MLVMPANLGNSAVAAGLEKFSFHSNPKERQRKAKECSNYRTIALVSHASKVSSRFSKLGFNSTWTENVHMFKLDLEKAKEPGIKLPTSVGSLKKQWDFQKIIYFCFIDYAKAFDCVDHNKLENSERDGNTRPPYLPLEKSLCRSRRNS